MRRAELLDQLPYTEEVIDDAIEIIKKIQHTEGDPPEVGDVHTVVQLLRVMPLVIERMIPEDSQLTVESFFVIAFMILMMSNDGFNVVLGDDFFDELLDISKTALVQEMKADELRV